MIDFSFATIELLKPSSFESLVKGERIMSPEAFIGLGLSGVIITMLSKSPKPAPSEKPNRKTIATVVLAGKSRDICILEDPTTHQS